MSNADHSGAVSAGLAQVHTQTGGRDEIEGHPPASRDRGADELRLRRDQAVRVGGTGGGFGAVCDCDANANAEEV
eukprot:COSAG06_NODE_19513_length_835_cov_0.711957_1_plen_75_part_00